MKFSISYKDAAGVTLRSECLAFDSDDAALAFAKADAAKNALVEVWKDDHLLSRLEQPVARP